MLRIDLKTKNWTIAWFVEYKVEKNDIMQLNLKDTIKQLNYWDEQWIENINIYFK